ncbi:hypothetical protein B0A52_09884 [Exophiala mesophila]|uniref:tRNA (adenine(58)-N(1))-methyltransferase catalytic subunit TRM61 n=1 Tax=Exophiala mesophila TaxID=212818 RepID=A0A438MRA8_EXOME|nr:hypothetical protein B0A52_09884 [Exophiala mesophila]
MLGSVRSIPQSLGALKRPVHGGRYGSRYFATRDLTRYCEGDRVVIDDTRLSPKLQKDASFDVKHGRIEHNDIIGKPISGPFYLRSKGRLTKLEHPTLEQYVSLSKRLVTPIYGTYSNSIISLLDIHPIQIQQDTTNPDHNTEPNDSPKQRLEVLEAGTGHGALTLHLARAIAAANPPPLPLEIPRSVKPSSNQNHTSAGSSESEAFNEAIQEKHRLTLEWNAWKATRSAVIHTVENVQANRYHAEKVTREFRQGLYWPHIDWYHDDLSTWVSKAMVERDNEAFLSYVCLDMPDAHEKLRDVHPAMKEGAKVLIFVPSVTQLVDCIKMIHREKLPFSMEQAVELGHGISSGRKWDVRSVKRRKPKSEAASIQPSATLEEQPEEEDETEAESAATTEISSGTADEDVNINADEDTTSSSTSSSLPLETSSQLPPSEEDPVVICRPQIGERTLGGVFVAVFRKRSPEMAELELGWRRDQTGIRRRFFR